MPLFSDHSAREILKGGSLSAAMRWREPAAAAAGGDLLNEMTAGGDAGAHGMDGRIMARLRGNAPEEFSLRLCNKTLRNPDQAALRSMRLRMSGCALAFDDGFVDGDGAHVQRLGTSYMTSSMMRSKMLRRPRAPVPRDGLLRDGEHGVLVHGKVHAVHAEQLGVLLDEGVLRLGEHAHELGSVSASRAQTTGQATDELGDQAKGQQVFRLHMVERILAG
jgi:hypothetical protein